MAATRLLVLKTHLQSAQQTTNPYRSNSEGTMSKSPITTHVLDTALGKPAAGVPVELSYLNTTTNIWTVITAATTNSDGRCSDLLSSALKPGTYRMHFDTASYFATQNNFKPFYPYAEVVFNLEDVSQHYHIPLLLSPYAYSTYRGS